MRPDQAEKTITAIHEADIEQARALLRGAIGEASNAWLSSAAIGDALMLEFIEVAGRCTSPAEIAEHLTRIADRLKQSQNTAH